MTLLDAGLQVFLFPPPFHSGKAFIRQVVLVGEGICIYGTHVVNTVSPLLSGVTEK